MEMPKCSLTKLMINANAHDIVAVIEGPFQHHRDSQAETVGLQVALNSSETFGAVASLRVHERHVGPAEGHYNIRYGLSLRSEQYNIVSSKSNSSSQKLPTVE